MGSRNRLLWQTRPRSAPGLRWGKYLTMRCSVPTGVLALRRFRCEMYRHGSVSTGRWRDGVPGDSQPRLAP